MSDLPLRWYASIGAKYLDLVGDYAGKEKFFIEGDSLLLECLSDPQLDFDPGFQLLHAAYLVERYLHNLHKRGCTFDVVFFDDHSRLCIPPSSKHESKYLLARAVVLKHLQLRASVTNVLNFKGLDDVRFSDYLQDSACYFALCSDSAAYKYSKQKSLQLDGHVVDSTEEHRTSENKLKLRTTIYILMNHKGMDVALLGGLTWQDSKVFAFVLERNSKSKVIMEPTDRTHNSTTSGPTPTSTFAIMVEPSLQSNVSRAVSTLQELGLPTSSRMTITASVLSSMNLDDHKHWVFPHLVHSLLLESLSLSARALPVIKIPPAIRKVLETYQSEFCSQATDHISGIVLKMDPTVVDLVDGRLFDLVLHNLAASLNLLPMRLETAVKALTKNLTGAAITPDLVKGSELLGLPAPISVAADALLPFSHPAFDKHLSSIHVDVDAKKQASTGRLTFELTHWHNSKMLVKHKGPKPRLEPWEERRAQRAHYRFLAQLTGYAASLTDATGKCLDPKPIYVGQPGRSKAPAQQPKPKGGHLGQTNKPKKVKASELPLTKRSKTSNTTPIEPSVVKQSVRSLSTEELLNCLANDGPRLDRSMDAQEDARVPFKPDGWQVRVLDEIDEGNSLLVVAPTSAGKTFISFYAMESVLRASDEAVLVYVAPTKALVNQIAAEVLGKFKKQYKFPGKTVYSIFTRDYRVYEPTKAQILVTVPHLLQIMLMSPNNKDWVPRIKTIIFDEVHSVSQAEDGLVWEQLLMASPCQIIALSATIGNVSEFSEWLSSAQIAAGRKFSLIQHNHRHSDLRKYLYESSTTTSDLSRGLPATSPPTGEGLGLNTVTSMKHIHPISSLVHPQRGVPPDLSLESSDCLVLWRIMMQHSIDPHIVPADLAPTAFFGSQMPVKADIINWGTQLKELLTTWMKDRDTSPFHKVVDDLRRNLQPQATDPVKDQSLDLVTNGDRTPKELLNSTLPMLCDLRANDALPAILFNYNRAVCEDIASHLLDQLLEAEDRFKAEDVSWQAKLSAYTQWLKHAPAREKALKQADQKSKKKKGKSEDKDESRDAGGSKADRAQTASALSDSFFETFDPSAPFDQFSFANIKKGDSQLMEQSIKQFVRVGISDRLIHAFRRGICVHHAGMNRFYRQAVEMFFRRGFLTVVVATGTLSLGINMPCKTVVFSGDSAYLTALNYRQASGRAGRRGFDLLGNVVFQGLPTDKALRLISSKLPDINGHFPLTTVFVLRLLTLLHGTNNAKYAMEMVDALLSKPRLFAGGVEFKQQVLHHVRFSIEYLRSQGLLNADGHPVGFSSCVSHLYFVENSSLAFHALLKDGYFHDIAQRVLIDEEGTLKKLMLVMSNLFGRRPLRTVETEEDEEFIKKSVSLVILPEMPKEAGSLLQEHNKQTLQTYRTYVSTFVEQHCIEPDMTLPFTNTKISPTAIDDASPCLPNACPAPKMRSPFAALSGLNDDFTSISDLCDTVRGGVFLEKAVIPYLEMGDELDTPLNAYLYDFYNHGSVKALLEANRIPRGDLWFLLKDFSLVLASIVTAIENFINPKHTGDMDLANDGEDELEDDGTTLAEDESAVSTNGTTAGLGALSIADGGSSDTTRVGTPEPVGSEMVSRSASPVKKLTKTKKKGKKTLDSWDDESSEESEVEQQDEEVDEAANKLAGEKAERELRKVYRMFKTLQDRFEVKFKKMWA